MRAKQTIAKQRKAPADKVWEAMRNASFLCIMVVIGAMSGGRSAESAGSGAVKIAVFEFELEDGTPAAA